MTGEFWTAERISQLRSLRDEGKTFSEIGKLWGVSKNVPLAKANRLGMLNVAPKVEPEPRLLSFPPSGRCLWATGDVGEAAFRWCAEKVERPGEAWCAEHRRRVYLRQGAREAE